MKGPALLSLPGLICSIACTIPIIVFCLINKSKLPDTCATHFDIHFQPDGYMSRDAFFYFSLLFPVGLTALVDLVSYTFLCAPLSAFHGIDTEYYKRFNRFNVLKGTMMNMMFVYGSLLSLFLFSIFEPNWEYNMRCEINPEQPVPCDYKMTVFPQLIVFIILMTLVSVIFFLFMKKYKRDDSLVESDSNYWVCGCYRNQDDDRVLVPKRYGIGYTVNLGNPVGVSLLVVILLLPVVTVGLVLLFQWIVCKKQLTDTSYFIRSW